MNFNVNMFNIDIRDVQAVTRTVNEINTMIQDVNTMITTVQTAANDAANMVRGIEDDINLVRELEQSARTAITDDINHLKSYIDITSGSALAALEPSIREVLSDTAELYLDYGILALEVIEKMVADAAAKPKKEKPEKVAAFKGRDVVYPTRDYPAFYLGVMASDITDPNQQWNWAFDLRDISSNPNLTNRPVTLKFDVREERGSRRQVGFNGSADFRTNPRDRFTVDVDGSGFPVNMGDTLSKVGINGFDANAAFSFNLAGRTDGGFSTGGDVAFRQAALRNPQGTIAKALDTAIQGAGHVDLGIQYHHWIGRADEFQMTTNILDLLAAALKRIVQEYAQRAMDEIERVLREQIAKYIDGRFVSKDELDVLFRLARGDKAALDDLKNILDDKKAEMEARVRALTDQGRAVVEQAVQQVREDINAQIDAIMAEAQRQADNIRSAAKQSADRVRSEANAAAKRTEDEAAAVSNPIQRVAAQAAAKTAADRLRSEGEANARRLEQEADRQAESVMDTARKRVEELRNS
jgi:hypothetical protein